NGADGGPGREVGGPALNGGGNDLASLSLDVLFQPILVEANLRGELIRKFPLQAIQEHLLGRLTRQTCDFVELLRLLLNDLVEVLGLRLQRLLAVAELLLEASEVLFLAGEFFLLLFGGIFTLLGPALQFANLGACGFDFASHFLPTTERLVASLE